MKMTAILHDKRGGDVHGDARYAHGTPRRTGEYDPGAARQVIAEIYHGEDQFYVIEFKGFDEIANDC